ncbi:MAG: bacitracin ABC transporter ATP-binding protein, partial [Eubacterium sp.]|nr:bacitracin ABC transporter ATP-binding protein [Eubacterium sp.]
LDPIKIVEIRKMLLDMNANGTTIMISSHILGEMDKLCSCYGFILDGKLIREVTEAEMQAEAIDVEEFFVDMAKGGQNE